MSVSLDSLPLRPLGLGEIFDRAVTLHVRNFVSFSIIALFLVVPVSVGGYFMTAGFSGVYRQAIYQMEHPKKTAQATPPIDVGEALRIDGVAALQMLLLGLLGPFATVAIAFGVARRYAGQRIDWRSAYLAALRRWPAVLAIVVVEACSVAGASFVGIVGIAVLAVIGVLVLKASAALGVAVIVLSVLLYLALIGFILMLLVAVAFMFYAVAVEDAGIGEAILSGFARIFNRSEFWRAVLVCLALFAVQLGIAIVALGLFGLFEFVMHSALLYAFAEGALQLLETTFVTILMAVYYFDVRVRREGLDLEASLERLANVPAPPA